ncbi:MAG: methyltransferase [Firmicutes bacterium HGW-Firmicutes-1]|nr:MAG: methyltransferase [Firmicutes bacterium HGW-Firmicutes-1]
MFTILLASIIGSVIGWERENKNRPAGLRTYSLVCMGSALVMITSYEIFNNYHTLGNFDPARLGAQVISGIGFLGAGTIIRDKFSVKGLTTAASLWVVACIGLTVGAGMYVTSIMISAIVYYVMHNLRCMDDIKVEMMNYEIVIRMKEQTGQIREVHKVLDKYRINVRDINISYGQKGLLEEENDDLNIVIHALIMDQFVDQLIIEFNNINGITSFYFSEL